MDASSFDVSELWDADGHRHFGEIPWTFFAYPKSLADDQRLPRDEESVRFLVALHRAGARVGILGHPRLPDGYCFACPFDEVYQLNAAIAELEQRGNFPKRFLIDRTEYLLSLVPPNDSQASAKKPHKKWRLKKQPPSPTYHRLALALAVGAIAMVGPVRSLSSREELWPGSAVTMADLVTAPVAIVAVCAFLYAIWSSLRQ